MSGRYPTRQYIHCYTFCMKVWVPPNEAHGKPEFCFGTSRRQQYNRLQPCNPNSILEQAAGNDMCQKSPKLRTASGGTQIILIRSNNNK